ncbi:hypothetical protein BKA82DRAFT_712343 [Pisolithus tinctorius]|uniref:Rhodopsin domain-containing protein n=1 Tax=Pisolithus tinctorius Marx 270 TaxID=870435 RepID=A0A0C3JXF0_PISTI|nr:hypothetical protein BKA82DRAFT_712343 [Pisolithus tinctorius]KIO02082.1 hypothetical protein M404DRAFT_712343 [Pisolithus tinctorius Marx 270]
MASSGLTIQQTEVVGTVLPIAAMVVTSFRLFVRMRQCRLWLDDVWAALAIVFDIISLAAFWLYLHDYARYSQNTRVALYYTNVQIFYAVVWSSRISILFTVVRLTSPGSLRRWIVRTAVAFVVAWMILGAQIFWTCEAESGWKTQPRPQCDTGRNVAIAQIITDVIGDTVLILAPFRLIHQVRLTKAQKIRLLSIFSTSAVTTVVSLTHAYYVFYNGGLKVIIAAVVEVSISLIVANLSVLVAFLFRISTEDPTTSVPLEFTSIITLGSQLIRSGTQYNPPSTSTMVVMVETQTMKVNDFGTGRNGSDIEAASLQLLAKPGPLHDT